MQQNQQREKAHGIKSEGNQAQLPRVFSLWSHTGVCLIPPAVVVTSVYKDARQRLSAQGFYGGAISAQHVPKF